MNIKLLIQKILSATWPINDILIEMKIVVPNLFTHVLRAQRVDFKTVDFKGLGGGQTELFHITENNQTEKENVCQKVSS